MEEGKKFFSTFIPTPELASPSKVPPSLCCTKILWRRQSSADHDEDCSFSSPVETDTSVQARGQKRKDRQFEEKLQAASHRRQRRIRQHCERLEAHQEHCRNVVNNCRRQLCQDQQKLRTTLESRQKAAQDRLLQRRERIRQTTAARVILSWWRHERMKRILHDFNETALRGCTDVKQKYNMTFEELSMALRDKGLLQWTKQFFENMKHSLKETEAAKAPNRLFLSAIMIMNFPEAVLGRVENKESKAVSEAAEKLSRAFNSLSECEWNNPSSFSAHVRRFSGAWNSFLSAFKIWQRADEEALTATFQKEMHDLRLLRQSLQAPPISEEAKRFIQDIDVQLRTLDRRISMLTRKHTKPAKKQNKARQEKSKSKAKEENTSTSGTQNSPSTEESARNPENETAHDQIDGQEIQELLEGLTDTAIAHEIAINESFQIKLRSNKHTARAREEFSAICAALVSSQLAKENFGETSHDAAMRVIETIRHGLIDATLPRHTRIRERIESNLDSSYLWEQIKNQAFDLQFIQQFILEMVKMLCAPSRDASVATLVQLQRQGDVVGFFVHTRDLLQDMREDLINFQISLVRPMIVDSVADRERETVLPLLQDHLHQAAEMPPAKLVRTYSWLQDAKTSYQMSLSATSRNEDSVPNEFHNDEMEHVDAILIEGLVALLTNLDTLQQGIPEVCEFDAVFIQKHHNIFRQCVIVSSIMAVIGTAVPAASRPLLAPKVIDLVSRHINDEERKDEAEERKEKTCSSPLDYQVISKECCELLKQVHPRGAKCSFQRQEAMIASLSSAEHPIVRLLTTRVQNAIRSGLNNGTAVRSPHPGLEHVHQHLTGGIDFVIKMHRLHRKVFLQFYKDFLAKLQ